MLLKNPFLTVLVIFGCVTVTDGQVLTKRALFLGNSYISVNNLPQMVADIASAMGDTLLFDSNTPGGHRLQGHASNATSLAKIEAGDWDHVILQEQSQFPSFPDGQVETDVFPYARALDSIIRVHNPCAETVFYMTWGRKNGDASNCAGWPPVCTYSGMDSLLNLRYRMMAEDNNGIVAPVGAVWNHIRANYPSIELYQGDESHPSVAGTYAAACSFYTTLFRKDPALITFNATLSATDAANIRAATAAVLYDNMLEWHIGEYDPSADFTFSIIGDGEVSFSNSSVNASTYLWDLGDGTTSEEADLVHTYATNETFTVTLWASSCGLVDSTLQTVQLSALGMPDANAALGLSIYPNPTTQTLTIRGEAMLLGNGYSLYDPAGKRVLTGRISSDATVLDLSGLSRGVYLFCMDDDLTQPLKVIKQ